MSHFHDLAELKAAGHACVDEDTECAICHEPLANASAVGASAMLERVGTKQGRRGCNHVFHRQCLKKWVTVQHKTTCPLCRGELPPGDVTCFAGDRGEGRIVSVERTDTVCAEFYAGDKERLVRSIDAAGAVTHFAGEHGEERRIRVERVDGVVEHYEGATAYETRLVRTVDANGTAKHFEGAWGRERLVER